MIVHNPFSTLFLSPQGLGILCYVNTRYFIQYTRYILLIIYQVTAAWYRNNFNKQTHLLMASSSLNTKLPVSEDVTCDQLGHTYPPPPL